jgi:putative ABC transport system ATP-binding protein
MDFIQVDNLVKQYGDSPATVTAVRGISFAMQRGEFISIMGESGSGKSTLLSMMGALNSPTSGKYLVEGIDIYNLGQEERADFRRKSLGFVFQSFHLIPYLTVLENVLLPFAAGKEKRAKKRALAEEALIRVGLAEKGDRLPAQISGGEQERVAIARAIVNHPSILFADEPTGNLDSKTTREIMDLLKHLNEEGMTTLMVTHNPECAYYAGRTLRLSDGFLIEDEDRRREGGNGRSLGEIRARVSRAETLGPFPAVHGRFSRSMPREAEEG